MASDGAFNKPGRVYKTRIYETIYSYRESPVTVIPSFKNDQTTGMFQRMSTLFQKSKRALSLMGTQTYCMDLST